MNETHELEQVIEKLEQVLHRIHANAAESPEWIRYQIDEVLKDRVDTYHEWDCRGDAMVIEEDKA